MDIQKKMGITVLLIVLLFITDAIAVYLIYGTLPGIIMIPSNFKNWKYFWEK
jgi:hypothetical protein